jgi:hypothetical protein
MKTKGLVFIALAKMGASEVGKMPYAFLTSDNDGSLAAMGGSIKNDCQAGSRSGNFKGILRSASSIICFEIIGFILFAKQAARIIPAAPLGEFNPAKMALVSRNTLNSFDILFLPDLFSG